MSEIKRSIDDLVSALKEQTSFLAQSCKLYDKGNENEAKRIALSIRVLLYDTGKSKSILSQLKIKSTTKFLDTAHIYNERNLMSSSCLTKIHISNASKTVKPLLEKYRNFPSENRYKYFQGWWDQIVLDDKINQFSRKNIVSLVADKDGGAHIDPELPQKYYNLTRNNSMGFSINIDGVEKPLKDFCLASIRQIGFEVNAMLKMLDIASWRY